MKVLAVYVPFHEFLSEFLLLQGLHFIDCWDWWVRVLSQGSAETSYSYAINSKWHMPWNLWTTGSLQDSFASPRFVSD
jgi:hypothetical protein